MDFISEPSCLTLLMDFRLTPVRSLKRNRLESSVNLANSHVHLNPKNSELFCDELDSVARPQTETLCAQFDWKKGVAFSDSITMVS